MLGLLLPDLPPAASAHVRAATNVLPCRPPGPDRLGPLLADRLSHAGLRVHGLVLLVLVLHLRVVVGLLALVACRDLGLRVVDMLQPVSAHDGRGGHVDLGKLLVLLLLHHRVQAAPSLERGVLGRDAPVLGVEEAVGLGVIRDRHRVVVQLLLVLLLGRIRHCEGLQVQVHLIRIAESWLRVCDDASLFGVDDGVVCYRVHEYS